MQPSEDERVLAALSHASIVANVVNLAGMIATALIWTMQRDRSPYVRAHALQALVYQGAVLLVSIVLALSWGVCLALSLLPAALRPDLYRASPPDSFWLALAGLVVPIGFGILATVYGLYGAYQVYRGHPFRYPLAGRLARNISVSLAERPQPTPLADVPPSTDGIAAEPPALVVPLAPEEPATSAAIAPALDAVAPLPDAEPAPAAPVLPEPPRTPARPATKRRARRTPTDEEL
jgi:uncharacterized Tic20 family protein